MKTTVLICTAVLLFAASSTSRARAEESSLRSLLPFAEDRQPRTSAHIVQPVNRNRNPSPSIWDKMGHDLQRLNNGTKRFFSNTANALCWKKESPPPSRTSSSSWRSPSKPKESTGWFKPFWVQEEPRVPQSTQEFVGMERPRM